MIRSLPLRVLTHLSQPLTVVKKDMRLDAIPLQNARSVAGAAEVLHLFQPRIARECIFKTRPALPKKILFAAQRRGLVGWNELIGRHHRHIAFNVSVFMTELNPLWFRPHECVNSWIFALAQ